MPANTQQTEAIKLISDWSKWIATIETASIAFIGSIFSKKGLSLYSATLLSSAIVSFILSIIAASCILISLPAAIEDINSNDKIWNRVATLLNYNPRLINVVVFQFSLFLLGIVLFALGVILLFF